MLALTQPYGPYASQELAKGLKETAARMEPKEAAATLTQAKTRTNEYGALEVLGLGLSEAFARRRKEEDPVSAQVAALTQAISKTYNRAGLQSQAQGLSDLAARLEPDDAAKAAAALTQAMNRTNDPNALAVLARALSNVAARLEGGEAARVSVEAAGALIPAMARTNDAAAVAMLTQGLSALLGDGRRPERARAVAAAVGGLPGNWGPPGALALLEPAAEPFPRRLSDQQLVDLLKGPLCVGPARRAVLDHLECRYGRAFADQWDFVRFAEGQKFGLDFTRPPQRP